MAKSHANADLDYKQLSRTLENGTSTKSAIVANKVGKFIVPVFDNVPTVQNAVQALGDVHMSIVQSAVQVLDRVSDLGKDMPFVAPAFVLLKFIIEVEKKAQEADAKCDDLLERITFMLSHLPVLKTVTVIEPTRLVIERMNGVLKNAAALIAAYRKQGAVARRLHLHNRDKFTVSVEAIMINGCSKDLMMSLQIHQTTRLDILTRGIPADPEDEAAKDFVASHGNLDTVKNDPELVSKFAAQQHLEMDDAVMEQLNTNITDTMQQTMGRLEGMLKENVSAAIVDGLKALAAEMNAAEAQQHFKCVQCEGIYTATTDGPQSCSFHRAESPCCGTSNPCCYQSHRVAHHCEYPYALFFPYARSILNSGDTIDKWVLVEDTNLESNTMPKAFAGQLLRLASRAALIQEPRILITVGTVWHEQPYYFGTFTAADLESAAESILLTGKTVIYRTSSNASEFALAEWVVSATNKISGIRLTAKAATSDSPFIRVCLIDAATCTKSGDVLTLSEGGLRSYQPATRYVLPDVVRVGPAVYTPVKEIKILDKSQLPVTIDPRQAWRLKFQAIVPRSKEDAQLQAICFNRALVARDRPLRLKLVLEDYESQECSTVLEYVFDPNPFDKPKNGDLGFFYFDDPARIERRLVRVEKPDNTRVLDFNGTKIETKRLEAIVYQALKSGETEVELDIQYWAKGEGLWEWNAWALVDLSCCRVYAFKILIKEGRLVGKKRFGCLGYVLCPSYGDVINASRPIRYAVEKVKLPIYEPYIAQEFPTDDKLDDFVISEPPKVQFTRATSVATFGQWEELNSNLSRIAEALERLVEIGNKIV